MFRHIKRIHFVGIGGAGMSGMAELLLNLGYEVTGSDLSRTAITDRLHSLGARMSYSHRTENVEGADVVVYSSAIMLANPELKEAARRKIPVVRRAEFLAELMRMKEGIAVAGTHGKTSTTSMVGKILKEANLDPTLIVGGVVKSLGSSARLGHSNFLVAEADEFDRSFLKLTPTIAVVTNIDVDHLDCYRNFKAIKRAFLQFLNRVPFYGTCILCIDDKGVESILPKIERKVITYGLREDAHIRASDVTFGDFTSEFTLTHRTETRKFVLAVPGVHNVRNALAAISVGIELEIPTDSIASALANFRGVQRRFEVKGMIDGVTVVDDYAHHPAEIEATLGATRSGIEHRVVTVFQPHLYTRTKDFFKDFAAALGMSDVLVVTDVYPAREAPIEGVSGELIVQAAKDLGHQAVHYVPELDALTPFLRKITERGDLLITMGAGDIWKIGEEFLSQAATPLSGEDVDETEAEG
jgi:UDP-N-acetylmuramate--alanine ligase